MKHYPIYYPETSKSKPILILIGKPASGKGIQGKLLRDDLGYQVINMSQILNEKSRELPEIKKQMENGILISDSLILKWIAEKLTDLLKNNQLMIIDGIPRTLMQARGLLNILSRYPHLRIQVIELQVANSEIKTRIEGRRICSQCGQSYHLIDIPPEKENQCDLCHAPLIIRKDDTSEVIEKRIATYKKEIKPIREYFQMKRIYQVIKTESLTPSQIHQTIKDLIDL